MVFIYFYSFFLLLCPSPLHSEVIIPSVPPTMVMSTSYLKEEEEVLCILVSVLLFGPSGEVTVIVNLNYSAIVLRYMSVAMPSAVNKPSLPERGT